MRVLRIIASLAVLYGILPIQTLAQVNTASLTGQITDANGGAITNASVIVKNKATGKLANV